MARIIDISRFVSADWKPHGGPGYSAGMKIEFPVILKPDMPDARGRTTRGFNGVLHTGTHIDGPEHMHQDHPHVGDLPLGTFMGEALIVDMHHKAPKGAIDAKDLEESVGNKIRKGDILIIRTGWSKNYGKENFFQDSPYITSEAAEWCIKKGAKLVGADCHPTKFGDAGFGAKKTFLGANVPFLSDLDGLDQIKKERVTVIAFPLKFEGVEASMVRAVAIEND